MKDARERQRELMHNTLERIYERIFENRHALRLAYAARANDRGVVPLTQWGRVLRDVTMYLSPYTPYPYLSPNSSLPET